MQRLEELTEEKYRAMKAKDVAAFTLALTQAKGDPFAALDLHEKSHPGNPFLHQWRRAVAASQTKSAVSAMDATTSGVLFPTELSRELIALGVPFAIIGRLGLTRVAFNVLAPLEMGRLHGYWAESGRAKGVTRGDFATTVLRRRTAAGIAVIPNEFKRTPQAMQLLLNAFALGVNAFPDTEFVADVVASVTPAASAGDLTTDLAVALQAFIASGGSVERAVVVLSSANAVGAKLQDLSGAFRDLTRQGGTAAGLPAVCSDSAGDNVLVLDAGRILLADDGELAVDLAESVTLEMSDAPTSAVVAVGSPAAPVMTSQVSMFQTDSTAVRLERFINWQILSGAAAAVTGANYLPNVGSPA
jgi:hypothetical protein